jgi:hypothetical protein
MEKGPMPHDGYRGVLGVLIEAAMRDRDFRPQERF